MKKCNNVKCKNLPKQSVLLSHTLLLSEDITQSTYCVLRMSEQGPDRHFISDSRCPKVGKNTLVGS